MPIEEILDQLDELIDRSWSLPLTGGRCVVDADKVRELLDDVRLNLPTEIRQAQSIVADRTAIVEEAKKGNVILVIDEIHSIVSAGDADGAMNAANILKPALSKGDIQVIGATTFSEYRKYGTANAIIVSMTILWPLQWRYGFQKRI